MSFQLCPKCDGEGTIPTVGLSNSTMRMCPVCGGMKIISTVSGLPPNQRLGNKTTSFIPHFTLEGDFEFKPPKVTKWHLK